MNLDPSKTKDRTLLCQLCEECAYWYQRADLHGMAARAYEPEKAIWVSLQPMRAGVLARRAARRHSVLRSVCYDRYTQAALKFLAENASAKTNLK